MVRLYRFYPALGAMLCVSGCTSGEQYPSLAIRDVERVVANPEATTPISATPQSRANIERASQLVARARQSHRKFMNAAPSAREIARQARGASSTSDAWSSAQIAIADLESIRSVTGVPLADLDQLYVDATLDFVQRAAIVRQREIVTELIAEEDRILAELGLFVRR